MNLIIFFIIAYVIYWIITYDEREMENLKSKEFERKKQEDRIEKGRVFHQKFGERYQILGKVIVRKENIWSGLNNKNLSYVWKKILISEYSNFPKVVGKIIEIGNSTDIYARSGQIIEIDLFAHIYNISYITVEELQKDLEEVKKYQRIDEIKIELAKRYVLKKEYAKERLLWQKYYEGLPSEYYENMNGEEFEGFIENLFIKMGYSTLRTKSSGDQGVDLIVDFDYKKTAIQIKKYKGKIGNSAVQEVVAGKKHYRCSDAWVITNSTFTESAIQLAKSNKVKLINGFEMMKLFRGLDVSHNKIPYFNQDKYEIIKPFAKRLYKINDSDFESIYTPYNIEIFSLEMELERLTR